MPAGPYCKAAPACAGFHSIPQKLLTEKIKSILFGNNQCRENTMTQFGSIAGMFSGRFFFSFRSVHPAL